MTDGPYYSETQKIRPKIIPYLEDKIVIFDYGCGGDLIVPEAIGIDMAQGEARHVMKEIDEVYDFAKIQGWNGKVDAVFSSHFLEHVRDDGRMLSAWGDALRPGGILALYLPDERYYDNSKNPEHLHWYSCEDFVKSFSVAFGPSFMVLDHGLDIGYDRYSFYMVARKI